MIHIRNIHKHFGDKPVLQDINLTVEKGTMHFLTGPSGSGKTTLLNIMGSLEWPDQGSVSIDGKELQKLDAHALSEFRNAHIGFVFQFHHLLPELTALENVLLPAWIGKSTENIENRGLELLDRLGVVHIAESKPGQVSGGERQRVALARALINRPKVVLADEPTGNLDSANSLQLFNTLKEMQREMDQTFVIVTHDTSRLEFADKITQLKDGCLQNT